MLPFLSFHGPFLCASLFCPIPTLFHAARLNSWPLWCRRKPACVLGLATGSSPLGLYNELIRLHRQEGLDFSQATTFNLDEYVGLGPTDPHSYRHFMQHSLFSHINVAPHNTHVPDGRTFDFASYGSRYEQLIRDAGGIDLQVLGIGSDGHIAFNEPGSSLGSRTRVKTLARETIRDNARFFGSEEKVPRLSITMGVGTILECRRCLLWRWAKRRARPFAIRWKGRLRRRSRRRPCNCIAMWSALSTRRPHRNWPAAIITTTWNMPNRCWKHITMKRWDLAGSPQMPE